MIELWHEGRCVARTLSMKSGIVAGAIKDDHLIPEAIVSDELSGGNKRVQVLTEYLNKSLYTTPMRQDLVYELRKRAREICECADALEMVMGLKTENADNQAKI